jgi:hypothetical protein
LQPLVEILRPVARRRGVREFEGGCVSGQCVLGWCHRAAAGGPDEEALCEFHWARAAGARRDHYEAAWADAAEADANGQFDNIAAYVRVAEAWRVLLAWIEREALRRVKGSHWEYPHAKG